MSEIEYSLKFPKTTVMFDTNELQFSINHIKSRLMSTLYFKLHCFDRTGENIIYTYTSLRWVIETDWKRKSRVFEIPYDLLESIYYTQIELVAVGIDSENPLYFTECMLNEMPEQSEYHLPQGKINISVGLVNSRYVNLYNIDDDVYLQVIRPNGDDIATNKLPKSTCTVLAPHLANESDIDDPVNIFMEFINQVDQRIDVLR